MDTDREPVSTTTSTTSIGPGLSPSYDLTELVAGGWQLRPWPAAHADLDDLLAERFPAVDATALARERVDRLEGWARGQRLGFAVREITTGASVAEVSVLVSADRLGSIDVWVRPVSQLPAGVWEAADVVRRWAVSGLGLTIT